MKNILDTNLFSIFCVILSVIVFCMNPTEVKFSFVLIYSLLLLHGLSSARIAKL